MGSRLASSATSCVGPMPSNCLGFENRRYMLLLVLALGLLKNYWPFVTPRLPCLGAAGLNRQLLVRCWMRCNYCSWPPLSLI